MNTLAKEVHDAAIKWDSCSANYIRCVNPESLELSLRIIQEVKSTTYSPFLQYKIDKIIENYGGGK